MKLTTTLFATSFAAVVVAGWTHLDAGPETDGPARQPALRDVTIDGQKLRVTIDRDRVPAGQTIRLTIEATEPDRGPGAGRARELRVAVLERTGSPMSRVMTPPREVLSRTVRLASGPVTVPIILAGAAHEDGGAPPDPLAIAGRATRYTVVVTSAKKNDPRDGAYLPVFAYEPEAYRLTVEPPGPSTPGQEVDLAVRVHSLATRPLRNITVGMSSPFVTIEQAGRVAELAPGADAVVHLRGRRTGAAKGPVLLQASGYAEYGGTAAAVATLDPATGALTASASAPAGAAADGLGDLL